MAAGPPSPQLRHLIRRSAIERRKETPSSASPTPAAAFCLSDVQRGADKGMGTQARAPAGVVVDHTVNFQAGGVDEVHPVLDQLALLDPLGVGES